MAVSIGMFHLCIRNHFSLEEIVGVKKVVPENTSVSFSLEGKKHNSSWELCVLTLFSVIKLRPMNL